MKSDNVAIGVRARAAVRHAFEGEITQAEVASRLAMTPDALSRALRGERGFASVELVELADLTGSDVHELITGEPDPHRLRSVARHDYDHDTGRRTVPGRDGDEAVLHDIALVYRQAGELAGTPIIPSSAEEMRAALGEDFVRPLVDRVEERLGVDVVRVRELSTCYGFEVGGRRVIAVDATGNWFRENFGVAHELGHFALGHHDEHGVPGRHERTANDFAAELLLPRSMLGAVDWDAVDADRLASLVWSYGVSTEALRHRLDALRIVRSPAVDDALGQSTQKLLRRHLHLPTSTPGLDEITTRMTDAATRRFPLALREAHVQRIAAGELGTGPLAWMLGVDAESLELDEPHDDRPVDPDRLGDLLDLTSS